MAAITCIRYAGDIQGDPVVEPILSADALVYRGTAELDGNAQQKTSVTINTVYSESVFLGDLISVADPNQPLPFKAKVVGMSIDLSHGSATQTFTLERPI